jgi:SAM-dependent methyltransferase
MSSTAVTCSNTWPTITRWLRELRRVLRDDGWALIQVPIWAEGETFEDPAITDPQERERVYGQHDHVRKYGRDFLERLRLAGFRVQVVPAESITDLADLRRMGIPPEEELFLCQRESRP